MSIVEYERKKENFALIRKLCRDFKYFETYHHYFMDPYYKVFCLWDNGIINAVLVFSRHSQVSYGDFLWVDEDFRNKGIGRRFLDFLVEYAKKHNFIAIQGDSVSTNSRAHSFYKKFGAEKFGEYYNFYGDHSEVIFMFRKMII